MLDETVLKSVCVASVGVHHVECPTLIVSKGCPEMTVQMPPNPPAKKFFTSLTLCFSVIVQDSKLELS